MDEKLVCNIIDRFTTEAERAERANKRFFVALITTVITLSITICFIVGAYFFSDYQYPTIDQIATQSDQKLEQSIK